MYIDDISRIDYRVWNCCHLVDIVIWFNLICDLGSSNLDLISFHVIWFVIWHNDLNLFVKWFVIPEYDLICNLPISVDWKTFFRHISQSQVVKYCQNEFCFSLLNATLSRLIAVFEVSTRLAKETKAERCFCNKLFDIAFHIFVKLVAQIYSFMHC